MPFSISSLGSYSYSLGLVVDLALALGLRQILVAPGVRADGVARGGDLLEDAGLIGGVQADREEDRLGAVRLQRREHGRGVLRPGAVVEGQHDLAFAQEVVALEMLEAEAGAAGGVDLDDARHAECIGIARARRGRGRRRRRSGSGCGRRLGGCRCGAALRSGCGLQRARSVRPGRQQPRAGAAANTGALRRLDRGPAGGHPAVASSRAAGVD